MSSFDIIFVVVAVDVWALFAMITGGMFRLDGIQRIALRLQVTWILGCALVRWTSLGGQAILALFRPASEPSEP